MHSSFPLISLTLCLVGASAFGRPPAADRFGAVYYPGEAAGFRADAVGPWQAEDAYGVLRAAGVTTNGTISVSHKALGYRYGAFRLTVGTNATWFAFLPSRSVKPCSWVGTGTHGGHGWQHGDLRYLDLIATAGIGVVRDDVNWNWFERKRGEIVFSRDLRNLVDGLKARGLRYDPILNGHNPAYADALDPEAFTRYALAFMREFKGKIDLCEIFNEPHNFNFPRVYLPEGGKFRDWQCRPDAPWIPKHAALTRKVADAIRAFDPNVTTGVGVEDYWDFFKIMLKQEFVRPTDLVTIHPYDHQHYPPEGNWFFRDGGKEVRNYLRAHGGATRIAITECGWTTYEPKKDATHAFVGNYPPCTDLQQAQYLIRFYILSRQHGIEFACQYDFRDDGPNRSYTEHNFGLMRDNYTPKPSFSAVAAMTRLLGEAEPCGSLSKNEKSHRLYAFRQGGRNIAAAWAVSGTAEVALPEGFSAERTTCLDIQGNERSLPMKGGRLVLTEEPLYLIALPPPENDLTRFVDPFVGTTATGHTTPAAAFPFGRIQAGPTTGTLTWEYCSGYRIGDTNITGYAQTALSGTGFCEYNELQVLPFSGSPRPLPMKSAIDKRTERASPGFYAVRQSEDGVNVEIAAARRAALYRFTWDDGHSAKVLVNLPYGNGQTGGNQIARSHDGRITRFGEGRIEGEHFRTGCIHRRKVAFALEFDRPWTSCTELPKAKPDELPRYVLAFDLHDGQTLSMKVALSMTSPEAARENLFSSIPDWNFAAVRTKAQGAWNDLLSRSTCEGTDEQKRNWYTALYHLYFQPNDYSDATAKTPFYSTLSLWDTFRAAQPWYTVVAPEVAEGAVLSFLSHYRAHGRLPVMSYGGVNFDCMIGNHAVPVLVDWFLKQGAPDTPFWRDAFAAVRNTLRESHPGKPKEDWPVYDKFGYFPSDLIRGEGVSRTFECAFDDACAAVMAERLGKTDDAAFFRRRAGNWTNVFDRTVGFARGKDSAGKWREPFDPYAFGHGAGRDNDFTEGNAFQYSWHVLHDPEGLFAAMGGRGKALAKLQKLFLANDTVGGAPPDVTGLIGQYVHGNEPSHHVIYLFTLLGRPDLTAKYVREVFDRFYRPMPDGLCGNDDCGQMSAWYLFSAMGFYPLNPCGGDYVLGAPQVPKATLNLPNGKRFTVLANGLSTENSEVRAVWLNGKRLKAPVLRHADILAGGELRFDMATPQGGARWVKHPDNPVMGGPELGTCFDLNVVPWGSAKYNNYFSWRPQKCIALARSEDGVKWTPPVKVLECDPTSGWEDNLNRASVWFKDGTYHLWYTGQARGYSKIGYATSTNGLYFTRVSKLPVLIPERPHEGFSVMNPYVRWDDSRKVWRMWYASGETYEPNVLCYAESQDGLKWEKSPLNPIFVKGTGWDRDRVGGCEVHPLPDGRWIMFYIGYSDIHTARIGAALSPDGITRWERLPTNPLVEPTPGEWDSAACYKPSVVRDEANDRWLLWYNGRTGHKEYIGLVTRQGLDLTPPAKTVRPSFARVLNDDLVRSQVDRFNATDDELYKNDFPNARAYAFLKTGVPRFECPDEDITRTYWFRWWTYRKHLHRHQGVWAVSEFLPHVGWSGAGNTIACPLIHHIAEGRWLRDSVYMEDYLRLILTKGNVTGPSAYANAPAWSALELGNLTGNKAYAQSLLDEFVRHYEKWEKGWTVRGLSLQDVQKANNYKGPKIQTGLRAERGLFDYAGDREGSEFALSADGARPMVNAMMWAEASSIATIARQKGEYALADRFEAKAADLEKNIKEKLWNPTCRFFTTLSREGALDNVCELHGYAPFYFGMPLTGYDEAWRGLTDERGFAAPKGLTFPRRDTPGFDASVNLNLHECLWNGPSWPYATSVALTGLYRTLQSGTPAAIGADDFANALHQYAAQQVRTREDGKIVPWIDENLSAFTGEWLARNILIEQAKARGRKPGWPERGKDYNHSSFCDLVLAGLCGFIPKADGTYAVRPLAPKTWDWWCADGIRHCGRNVTILYDRTGTRYGRGKGLVVLAD